MLSFLGKLLLYFLTGLLIISVIYLYVMIEVEKYKEEHK